MYSGLRHPRLVVVVVFVVVVVVVVGRPGGMKGRKCDVRGAQRKGEERTWHPLGKGSEG